MTTFTSSEKGKKNIITSTFFPQAAALCTETHSTPLYFTSKQDARACSRNIAVAISRHVASAEMFSVILPRANELPWKSAVMSARSSTSSAAICKTTESLLAASPPGPLMARCYSRGVEKSGSLLPFTDGCRGFVLKWDVCSFTAAAQIFCLHSYISQRGASARRWIFCDCSVIDRRRCGRRDSSSLKCQRERQSHSHSLS